MGVVGIGRERLTVGATVVSPTDSAWGKGARHPATEAMFRCAVADVLWADDGEDPAADDGQPLHVGEVLNYDGDLYSLKFIRAGDEDATIICSYWR